MSYQSRLYCSAVAEGRLLAERYKSFHHMTACACSSWFTEITFIPIFGSPPNTIGCRYHFIFPRNRSSGTMLDSASGRTYRERNPESMATLGTVYTRPTESLTMRSSAQANHLMARNKPRDRIAIRRRRDLRLIEGNEIFVAKPALGHRKSKIQSVVDRLFEIHVDTIRAAK